MRYSFSETIKNAYSLVLTKIFDSPARLIRRPVYIRGKKGFSFGEGFTCGYRLRVEVFTDGEVKLKIGKRCKLGDQVHLVASDSVTIGDDCLFASNVFVSDTDHGDASSDPMLPPDQRKLSSFPTAIGNCVWLGEGVAVLPGSKIGDGCIIGAHAVVKGEIPPYTVAVGAPARPVKKYNFETKTWEKIDRV